MGIKIPCNQGSNQEDNQEGNQAIYQGKTTASPLIDSLITVKLYIIVNLASFN